jgi:hypothetical protein
MLYIFVYLLWPPMLPSCFPCIKLRSCEIGDAEVRSCRLNNLSDCFGIPLLGLLGGFTQFRGCALGHLVFLGLDVSRPKSSSDYYQLSENALLVVLRGHGACLCW